VNLARLQGDFLDAILAREEPADARLAVYHRSVRANHDAALAAAYPVVRRLVGDAFFGEAAARYAQAFPSRCGDLHVYGSAFALFLAQYEHARDLAYLPDVARLEWAVHESRHAARGGSFDYARLGSVGAERLGAVRIALRPCVRLVSSVHPVLAIWEANQEGRDGTPERTGAELVAVGSDRAFEVRPVAVGTAEWALLEAFAQGASLAEAAREFERRSLEFQAALSHLAALDLLDKFHFGPA
jgi:hypothetical protein